MIFHPMLNKICLPFKKGHNMAIGTVKWISNQKGYGFIQTDD
jgi:hypothetical protein